jgi:hypothetical protein
VSKATCAAPPARSDSCRVPIPVEREALEGEGAGGREGGREGGRVGGREGGREGGKGGGREQGREGERDLPSTPFHRDFGITKTRDTCLYIYIYFIKDDPRATSATHATYATQTPHEPPYHERSHPPHEPLPRTRSTSSRYQPPQPPQPTIYIYMNIYDITKPQETCLRPR